MNLKAKLFMLCLPVPMTAAAQDWHGQIGVLTLHGREYAGADNVAYDYGINAREAARRDALVAVGDPRLRLGCALTAN